MVKFDISNTKLCAGGGKVLVEGLKGNQVVTEFNISNNYLGRKKPWDDNRRGNRSDMSGIIAIGYTIPTMGTMTALDISNNDIRDDGCKHLFKALTGNHILKELNIAGNSVAYNVLTGNHDISGVIAIGDTLPTMGTLMKFDISINDLYEEGTKVLARALTGNQVLTELNISNNYMTYGYSVKDYAQMAGMIAIADTIPTMKALTSLDISWNHIGELVLPEGWSIKSRYGRSRDGSRYVHVDGREQTDVPEGSSPVGAIALAGAIRNNTALLKVDIS